MKCPLEREERVTNRKKEIVMLVSINRENYKELNRRNIVASFGSVSVK